MGIVKTIILLNFKITWISNLFKLFFYGKILLFIAIFGREQNGCADSGLCHRQKSCHMEGRAAMHSNSKIGGEEKK